MWDRSCAEGSRPSLFFSKPTARPSSVRTGRRQTEASYRGFNAFDPSLRPMLRLNLRLWSEASFLLPRSKTFSGSYTPWYTAEIRNTDTHVHLKHTHKNISMTYTCVSSWNSCAISLYVLVPAVTGAANSVKPPYFLSFQTRFCKVSLKSHTPNLKCKYKELFCAIMTIAFPWSVL